MTEVVSLDLQGCFFVKLTMVPRMNKKEVFNFSQTVYNMQHFSLVPNEHCCKSILLLHCRIFFKIMFLF